LPKDARHREALARQVGADGDQLLDWVQTADTALGLSDLPALEALRQIWLQPYDHGPVPGLAALRWRTGDAQPPAAGRIASPDALEARDRSQRETHGVGSKLPLTATCDADPPALITPVMTTPATTPDRGMGPAIHPDWAERELLPGTH
jgi:transposase